MPLPTWQIHAREKAREAANTQEKPMRIGEIQQRIKLSLQNALDKTSRVEDISYEEMIRYMIHTAYQELRKQKKLADDFSETLRSPKHETGHVTLTNNFHTRLPYGPRWNEIYEDADRLLHGRVKNGTTVTLGEYGKDIAQEAYTAILQFYGSRNFPSYEELSTGIFEKDAQHYRQGHPFYKLFYYGGGYRSDYPNIFKSITFMILCKMIRRGYRRI